MLPWYLRWDHQERNHSPVFSVESVLLCCVSYPSAFHSLFFSSLQTGFSVSCIMLVLSCNVKIQAMAICCLFFFGQRGGFVYQNKCLASAVLCPSLPAFVSETIQKHPHFTWKQYKDDLMFLQCWYCERMCIFFFSICNMFIEMSVAIWALICPFSSSCKEMSFKPISVFVLNLMSLCGKHSFHFLLNKMTSFLTVHQADPWVFFIKSESEKCAVIDLQVKANVCCFVSHEVNRSFAYCMSNTNTAFVRGPINEGGFGGVAGQFLLFGCLPAQQLPARTTTQLSHAVRIGRLWKRKPEYRKGWRLYTVIICFSPSSSPPLSVSLSSVCEPCCDQCSERRKRLFVQNPATCQCSCKHTDEYCKERQLELNERTCK